MSRNLSRRSQVSLKIVWWSVWQCVFLDIYKLWNMIRITWAITYYRPTWRNFIWDPFIHRFVDFPLQWRHNERDSVSNHQPHDYLLDRLFRRRSTKTSKLRVTGLCAGNLPGTGEFPAQMASYAENVSIWWSHHATKCRIGMACDYQQVLEIRPACYPTIQ